MLPIGSVHVYNKLKKGFSTLNFGKRKIYTNLLFFTSVPFETKKSVRKKQILETFIGSFNTFDSLFNRLSK